MKNIYIYCEGQTEESFVNGVLYPYFRKIDIYVTPIIHKTKRTSIKSYKGGVGDYKHIKGELLKLCKNPNVFVTTMFDYYGMPSDTPFIDYVDVDLYKQIEYIEQKITDDIGCKNFKFNFVLHEFEGLLFSDVCAFKVIANDSVVNKLNKIREKYQTPEHINNSVHTAPSKRIESVISDYLKVRQGILVAKNIGIDKIISECKHFSKWINMIKDV